MIVVGRDAKQQLQNILELFMEIFEISIPIKTIIMKKVLFGFLTFGLVNLCNAQTADKKEEVKFTPPVIEKNKSAKNRQVQQNLRHQ